MANPTSRRPILKKNVEAFVPSPRFLSESPARQPSSGKPTPAHISYPGQPLPPYVFSPSPSRQLRSPVPPPPANLFGGNTSAFNVDPDIPFLATVGASDAGNSDHGSINEKESPKHLIGGLVTGLKKALTVKGSRRQSSKYLRTEEDIYSLPPIIRDSGYAASDQLEEPPTNQRPPVTTFSPPPPPLPQYPPLAASKLPNDYQTTIDTNINPTATPHDFESLDSQDSAISAHIKLGPDYAKMDRPTPPHSTSDVSLNTRIVRIQNFVHDVVALPWIANDRVTVDYYPAAAKRSLSHRPAILWRSRDYNGVDYDRVSNGDSPSPQQTTRPHVRGSSRTSRAEINLGSEFSSELNSPLPYHPPNTVQTPDRAHVQSGGTRSGLEGEIKSWLPNGSKSPHRRWEEPITDSTQMFVSSRVNSPAQLLDTPLFPPNNGPTPDMSHAYVDDPHVRLPTTPPARRTRNVVQHTLASSPPDSVPSRNVLGTHTEQPYRNPTMPKIPSTRNPLSPSSTQRSADLFTLSPLASNPSRMRQSSRNNDNPAYSNIPPAPRPNTREDATPTFPRPGPTASGQRPTPGPPSRRSRRSHTPSQRPNGETAEEWERFPQYRPGYVPFEYSENYYGTRYGVGIHGLLPPIARVPSAASTAPSIKQPRPQYPISTLATPPSGTNSPS